MNDDHGTISDYDTVTAADIADFTHYLAELRYGQPRADDPAERALFLARKADLLTRIAAQHTRTDPDYAEHVLQLARDAHAAAEQAALQLPLPAGGANSQENPTPTAPTRWGQITGELRGQFRGSGPHFVIVLAPACRPVGDASS